METPLENILSNFYKDEMISFMETHPEYFEEAIKLAISDKQPYSWRAAFLLGSCMENNDKRVQGYINDIIDSISVMKDGQQRDLLKILILMELNDEQEAVLLNICMGIWEKINKVPSVRLTAFRFIIKIADKHPDLKNEIVFLTQDHYLESLSPAVKRSIARRMKKIGL